MDKKILKAEERKIVGRKVKTVRAQGFLPGNIYGKKVESKAIQVNKKEFELIYGDVGETGLIMLQVGKGEFPVLVSNVQKHPISDDFIHVDFKQVDLKSKVTAEVPIEVVGESQAEKQAIGTVVQYLNQVEVEALPMDLPEKFEVEISNLSEVDQAIYVKDLKVDVAKIEIKTNAEEIVVKVEPPQKEEVIEVPVVPTEGPTSAEATAGGEVPIESSEAPKEEPKA